MPSKSKQTPHLTDQRWRLALIITIISIAGIAVVAAIVLIFSDKTNRPEVARMIFTATIPLLASWVGTVLAYYFSSESLDAATRNVKELVSVEEKLKSIPVSTVMIKMADIARFDPDGSQKVQDILDDLKAKNKGERLPFLDNDNKPVYMLHKSSIDSALVAGTKAENPINITTVTLKELFAADPSLLTMATESFGVVGKDATLESVRHVMNNKKNCQDVFVTEKGTKDSAVVGWITNGIIEENSKL